VSDRDLQEGRIIPPAMNREVAPALAAAIVRAAKNTGEARLYVDGQLVERYSHDFIYEGIMAPVPVLNETLRKEMQA
jgi:hypothetical protein